MDNTQHPNNYDNKAAHDTLKKMMMRKDILDLFFNIDKYGFCSVRVKSSKQPNSIEYQIGYDGYVWIMAYLMQGLSTQEIADRMCLSVNTIQTYRKRLLEKMNAKNVAELVSKCKGLF